MSRTTALFILLAVIFLGGVALALYHLSDVREREVVNQYRGSAFSFTYPLGLEIEEYSDGVISIGSTTSEGFRSSVNLTVFTPGEVESDQGGGEMLPFLSALCVSDNPSEKVYCEEESRSVATNAAGVRSEVYHLTLVRERAGAEPERVPFGPVYLYITPKLDESAESSYAVLVVSNPVSAVLAGAADTALLTRINDAVVVGEKKP